MTASLYKLILIVDDDVNGRLIIKEFLLLHEYEVIEAYNGEQALNLLITHTPDLILSDISMPGTDGLAMIQAIRAKWRFRYTPIITLSGYSRPEDQQAALSAGATSHLTKPINIVDLLREIKDALSAPPNTSA